MPDKTSHDDLAARTLAAIEPATAPPIDPIALARRDLQKSLPRRFYAEARAEARDGGFVLLLDGRPAKTPAKNLLAVPTRAAGEALAAEWARQAEILDPTDMPLTRIVNSAIDGVARDIAATAAEIVRYAASDLVCYRAGAPDALVAAQAAAWDPYLAFARDALGARFVCAEGVMFVEQPEPARDAIRAAVDRLLAPEPAAPFRAAALHVMTTLTGSALIALRLAHGAVEPAAAWAAAHVDEDFEMELWGPDDEALARMAKRWREMEAAVLLWRLVAEDTIS
jgi:chaperone required for assembly of F1-ATPase